MVAFGDKTVRQVLTPRPNIVAISQDATLEELRQLVITEQYSRIPAYDGDIDNITGFVHVRDMFELDEQEQAGPMSALALTVYPGASVSVCRDAGGYDRVVRVRLQPQSP